MKKLFLLPLFACLLGTAPDVSQAREATVSDQWRRLTTVTQYARHGDLVAVQLDNERTKLAWVHGTPAAPPPTGITCNLVTGLDGLGATCIATKAVCDNVANDGPAFLLARTWMLANQSGQPSVTFYVPPTNLAGNPSVCYLDPATGTPGVGAGVRFANGATNLIVSGYGATLTNHGSGSPGFFLGGEGIPNINGEHNFGGKTATVSAGATSITLSDCPGVSCAAKVALFTVGQWAVMTGFDMQGLWFSQYGYPVNPAYYDYVLVSAINAGTGQITFATTPLTYDYLSTWPEVSIDVPGPATLYQLPASWNIDAEYKGLTLDQSTIGTTAVGRWIKYVDVVFTGSHGGYPTQNQRMTWTNVDCSGCLVEADKIVDYFDLLGTTTVSTLQVQSMSPKLITATGLNALTSIKGTGRKSVFTNVTTPDFRPGVSGNGRNEEFSCVSGCNLGLKAFAPTGIYTAASPTERGVQNVYTMASGVIKVPNAKRITGLTQNGANTQLTVSSTAGFTTGKYLYIQGIRTTGIGTASSSGTTMSFTALSTGAIVSGMDLTGTGVTGGTKATSSCSAAPCSVTTNISQTFTSRTVTGTNGEVGTLSNGYQITVDDATHVTLTGFLWASLGSAVYVSSPTANQGMVHAGNPMNWMVPRSNLQWGGAASSQTPFYITDVYQDADFIYAPTNLAGGFPGVPLSGGLLYIGVHPAPVWSCPTCTGHPLLVNASQATPGLPLYSYSKWAFNATAPICPALGSTVVGQVVAGLLTVTSIPSGCISPEMGIQRFGGGIAQGTYVQPYGTGGTTGVGNTGTYRISDPTVTTAAGSSFSFSPPAPVLWGNLTTATWAVSTAYTGATGTLTIKPRDGDNIQTGYSTYRYDPTVNLKTTGTRVSNSAGNTNFVAGDIADILPANFPTWLTGGGFNGFNISAAIAAECAATPAVCPVGYFEVITSQPVILPYLFKKDIDRTLPTNDNTPMFLNKAA